MAPPSALAPQPAKSRGLASLLLTTPGVPRTHPHSPHPDAPQLQHRPSGRLSSASYPLPTVRIRKLVRYALYAVVTVGGIYLLGYAFSGAHPGSDVLALSTGSLLVLALLIVLKASAEELIFRFLLPLLLCSLRIRHPLLLLSLPALAFSCLYFGHPWYMIAGFGFGLIAGFLVLMTAGAEAGFVLNSVLTAALLTCGGVVHEHGQVALVDLIRPLQAAEPDYWLTSLTLGAVMVFVALVAICPAAQRIRT